MARLVRAATVIFLVALTGAALFAQIRQIRRRPPVPATVVQPAAFNPPDRGGDSTCCCCVGGAFEICTYTEDCALFPGGVCTGPCTPDCIPGPPCGDWGACCWPDGTCYFDNADNCQYIGGVFLGPDTECDGCPICPQLGACFVDGQGCLSVTEDECATVEGVFQGPGSCCSDYGPCYIPGETCDETTKEACMNLGGIFGGPNQTCDLPGACVDKENGQCTEVSEQACGLNGVFYPNQTCNDFVFGPCLQSDGACLPRTQGDCESAGGVWGGSDPDCACGDIDCICAAGGAGSAQCEEGACRNPQDPDLCEIKKRVECRSSGGVFCGGGSTCDDECPTAFVCCVLNQGVLECDVMDIRDCSDEGGTVNVTRTSCASEDPCLGAGQPCDNYAIWTGAGSDDDITNPDNWSTKEPPTATSSPAAFQTAGNVVVNIPDNVSLGNLLISQGSVGFLFGGNTVTASGTSPLCHDLIIGNFSGVTALLDVNAGRISAEIVSLGLAPEATGALQVGGGGSLTFDAQNQPELWLGLADLATGLLVVEGGGQAGAPDLLCQVGHARNSLGELIVRNPGTIFDSALLTVGANGTGSLELTASAHVDVRGVFQTAVAPGSVADVTIFGGSTLKIGSGPIDISLYGTSTVTVNDATVDASTVATRHAIGVQAGSSGEVLLRGGASWDASDSPIAIGTGGHGSLDIGEGSSVTFHSLAGAGLNPGSRGTILVDGPQSTLRMLQDPMVVLDVGLAGVGQVSLTNGALLDWKGRAAFGRLQGGEGTLTVNNASALFDDVQFGGRTDDALISVGRAMASVGNGGIMDVNGAIHVVGMDATFDNELLVGGIGPLPGVVTSNELRIGRSAVARVSNGGQLRSNSVGVIGDGTYGIGSVNPARVFVDGQVSTWNVGELTIGEFPLRPGRLEVTNGGSVNAGSMLVGLGGWVFGPDDAITIGGSPTPAGAGGGTTPGIFTEQLFVEDGAVLEVPGVLLLAGGILGGGGTVEFDIVNEGEMSPGDAPGVIADLTVSGNYQQTENGILRIELGEAGTSDTLMVTGIADLGGTLHVRRANCATVLAGQEHVVLTANDVQGTFAEVIGPFDVDVTVDYQANQVVVSISESIYNADCVDPSGVVDVREFLAVLAQWGQAAGCDVDGDGTVDEGDFMAVLQQWGPCNQAWH